MVAVDERNFESDADASLAPAVGVASPDSWLEQKEKKGKSRAGKFSVYGSRFGRNVDWLDE